MDEVDEGFGSNESNHSNLNKEELLNDLKCLNGQKVLDTATKLDKILGGNVCTNGNSNVNKVHAGDKNKNGIVNETDINTKAAVSQSGDVEGKSSDSKKIDNELDTKTNEAGLEPCHSDSKNNLSNGSEALINTKPETFESNRNGNQNKDSSNEVVNKEIDSKDKVETDSTSVNDLEDKNITDCDDSVTVGSNQLDKISLNKRDLSVIKSSENTPVKQTSSADSDRSPFLLDDKVRNSLKGLVAKVKSSELSKEVPSPAESLTPTDNDAPSYSNKDINNTNELTKHDNEDEKASNSEIKDSVNDGSSKDYYDDCILEGDDDDDGIAMEIGSENEDDLLELSIDNESNKECNSKTKEALTNDSGDDNSNVSNSNCTDTKSRNSFRIPESGESNSQTPLEISSDMDETSTLDSEKTEIKSREESVEKMQFEDDSNSVGSNGRINEIVDFLNHDLSGTNSPLTTSDSNKTEDTVSMIVEDGETKGGNKKELEEKQSNDVVILDSDDSVKKDDDMKEMAEGEKNEIDIESSCDELGMETSNKLACEKSEKEKISKDTPSSLSHEIKSSQTRQDEGNSKSISGEKSPNVSEGEDDDVIFEGATMPAVRNEFQKRNLAGNSVEKTSETVKNEDISKNESSYTNEKNNGNSEAAEEEEDDDVIFEKETKLEVSEPKQNCDTKTLKSDESASVKNIEIDADGKKPHANDIEDKTNAKETSVIPKQSSDRKRSAEDKELNENNKKRSKLDLSVLIGRLGSRVDNDSIEVSDSEDDEEEITSAAAEAENNQAALVVEKKEENLITVTEKQLEELVREKVKLYLTSQKDTLIAKLSQKVKDLQMNNDLWKRQVKDLQVKVNDVTVLQQKLEKRKAATAALRQITTRNVAIQVDEGRTSSSKKSKSVAQPPPTTPAPVSFVTSPVGTGTIRLPMAHTTAPPVLPTQMVQGPKMVTTTYPTPSVKSLLDTTRVQKTVGSLPSSTTTTVGTSMIGLVQYPATYVAKPNNSQGYIQQQSATQSQTSVATALRQQKSPNPTAKVIDLTEDDDSLKTRLVTLPPGVNQRNVQHVLAPPGTQFIRTGNPNQPTYQLVLTSPPSGLKPGVMVTMAAAVNPGTSIIQTMPQSQNIVSQTPAIPPGATLARAAVPSSPITPVKQFDGSGQEETLGPRGEKRAEKMVDIVSSVSLSITDPSLSPIYHDEKGQDKPLPIKAILKEEIEDLKAPLQGTDKMTRWAVNVFKAWISERKIEFREESFEYWERAKLDSVLKEFYASLPNRRGKSYFKSTLVAIRAGLNRHLNTPPFSRQLNLMGDQFPSSNRVFNVLIKHLDSEGKGVRHREAISFEDMEKLYESGHMSPDRPETLQNKVLYELIAHFGSRGSVGMNDLKKDAFVTKSDSRGRRYLTLLYNKSLESPYSREKLNIRMYETSDKFCPLRSYEKYLSKLHPKCEKLFQRPLHLFKECDKIWYKNKSLGVNRVTQLMNRLSIAANLSQRYTNYCIQRFPVSKRKKGVQHNEDEIFSFDDVKFQESSARTYRRSSMETNTGNTYYALVPFKTKPQSCEETSLKSPAQEESSQLQNHADSNSFSINATTYSIFGASAMTHPAPCPPQPLQQTINLKGLPPKPSLKISRVSQGIVLSWNMSLSDNLAEISNYQLFAYQETSAPPSASLWKKVGDVKALPLPMACTLTQFTVGNKYHFAVRAMDVHNRVGQFSDPGSIHLTPNTPSK